MAFLRVSLIALTLASLSTSLLGLPARSDIQIRVDNGVRYYRSGYRLNSNGIPVTRYVYPDGRVIERFGYSRGRRDVLVLPSPGIIQHPVIQPQIIQQPTQIIPQTRQPRLLHGQRIAPLNALVIGAGNMEGREGPGRVYRALTHFVAGQTVTVTQVAGGGDGYDWFLAASGAGQYAWLRGDRLAFYEYPGIP